MREVIRNQSIDSVKLPGVAPVGMGNPEEARTMGEELFAAAPLPPRLPPTIEVPNPSGTWKFMGALGEGRQTLEVTFVLEGAPANGKATFRIAGSATDTITDKAWTKVNTIGTITIDFSKLNKGRQFNYYSGVANLEVTPFDADGRVLPVQKLEKVEVRLMPGALGENPVRDRLVVPFAEKYNSLIERPREGTLKVQIPADK